jgi:hypothetical protein
MAYRFRKARAPTSRGPSSALAGEAREIVHDLHNNVASMNMWLVTLLERRCAHCNDSHEEVAAGIRRNLTSMLAATRRLTQSRKRGTVTPTRSRDEGRALR